MFKEFDEGSCDQVGFGDSSVVQIKGKGSVLFKCKDGEHRLLSVVYYIPSLCINIISLGQLTEQGSKVILEGAFLWVYDSNKVLVMKVKRTSNRLYKILLHTCDPVCLMANLDEPA